MNKSLQNLEHNMEEYKVYVHKYQQKMNKQEEFMKDCEKRMQHYHASWERYKKDLYQFENDKQKHQQNIEEIRRELDYGSQNTKYKLDDLENYKRKLHWEEKEYEIKDKYYQEIKYKIEREKRFWQEEKEKFEQAKRFWQRYKREYEDKKSQMFYKETEIKHLKNEYEKFKSY